MAKLAVLLAAVFGVLLVAASAHRTTITTVEVDEDMDENQRRRGQSCSSQELRHCQQFLNEQAFRGSGSGSQYGPGSQEFDPRGQEFGQGSQYGRGSRGMRGQESSQHFQPCCSQLRQLEDQQCMCQALRDVVRREQSQVRGQQIHQLAQAARQLPQWCQVGRSCEQIRAVYV